MFKSNQILTFVLATVFALPALAQENKTEEDKYIESDVISLVDRTGFTWQTPKGDFKLKPYMLVLTKGEFNYVDDEGLNIAEVDNVVKTGFGIPKAILGFAGRAFDKITYNFAIDAAASGNALLNQAWFDINMKDEFRLRVGKFKTPMNRAYQVRLGQSLLPVLPTSLTTSVNLPYSLNAVNPVMSTGFDIGVMAHGLLKDKWMYQVAIFNGTGIGVNKPTNTLSDDLGIPSLLYSGRLAYQPHGAMPLHEGDPEDVNSFKMSLAASASYNVEANYESSNDLRVGAEFAVMSNRFYFSSEAYLMSMDFVERQKVSPALTYYGAYAQAGYLFKSGVQPVVRMELMDRNSTDEDGILLMPAVGFNYFILGQNLKLQTMYQVLLKSGHVSDYEANDDDNGLSEHRFIVQLQFSF
ncbi:MAG: porin [Bacteroidales bacterium]|nr:MAG: porin [Bacteroidales bacterium]